MLCSTSSFGSAMAREGTVDVGRAADGCDRSHEANHGADMVARSANAHMRNESTRLICTAMPFDVSNAEARYLHKHSACWQ